MFDYYDKIMSLSEEKLTEEIERISKRLLKTNPTSPTYNQLLNMLDTAESAYQEKIMIQMHKKSKDEVINIGEIEKDEYTPDYTEDDLVIVVARTYLSDNEKDKK